MELQHRAKDLRQSLGSTKHGSKEKMRTTDVVSTQDVNSGEVGTDPNKQGTVADLPLLAQTPPNVPGHDVKQ